MTINRLGSILITTIIVATAPAASPALGQGSRWAENRPEPPERIPEDRGLPPPPVAAGMCVAFEGANYEGRRLETRQGAEFEFVGRAWNDRISSIACAPGCRLIAYQTIVFSGPRANFIGATPVLGGGWNDRISALRVTCGGEHAAAERH